MKLPSLLHLLLLLLLPLRITCLPLRRPHDCNEVEKDLALPSQVYTIYPIQFGPAVKVFCDMDTDEGNWTVFQRRYNGEVNFYRPWEFYRDGFGNSAGEYWLGLENLYHLTKNGAYQLRIVLEDFEGETVYAQYDSFYIDAESDGYTLHVSAFSDGGAGDSLRFHDGQKFSTHDNDQDNSMTNCAQRYFGGFWYNACHNANPTGIYQQGPVSNHYSKGIIWSRWKGYGYSVKAVSMMLRPRS